MAQYIVLPPEGTRGKVSAPSVLRKTPPPRELRGGPSASKRFRELRQVEANVVDELVTGPKLVVLPEDSMKWARESTNGRILPVREYAPAAEGPTVDLVKLSGPPPGAMGSKPTEIEVRCAKTSARLSGATVTALVDQKRGLGAQEVTGDDGTAKLNLGPAPVEVEALQVQPPEQGSWGAWETGLTIFSRHTVALAPVDIASSPTDVLRYFYGVKAPGGDGTGVRVAVIDSGVGPHPDLYVTGGANLVEEEDEAAYGDNGIGHGTHVAGIIAAAGEAPTGLRGLAPEAELWSLRIYPPRKRKTNNYLILKALLWAQIAKCDIVNLALQATGPDEVMADAIRDAQGHGMLVFGASGNDGRRPVSSPARYASAVTAMGRLATFPAGSLEAGQVATPAGADPEDFLANFSNVGQEVGLTAPGVGVVSCVPDGYGPKSGTSMAAAAASGMAARLLSSKPELLAMKRNRKRFEAMQNFVNGKAEKVGFGFDGEGYGMLGR